MTSQLSAMNAALSSSRIPLVALVDGPEQRAERCRKTTARVVALKALLIERYRLAGHPPILIREAIAAAEAQARLAGFPQLFLPELADEMVRQLRQKWASIHPEYAQAA